MPSMPSKNPAQRLRDIVENIDAIAEFTSGMDLAGFSADRKTVYAVVGAVDARTAMADLWTAMAIVRNATAQASTLRSIQPTQSVRRIWNLPERRRNSTALRLTSEPISCDKTRGLPMHKIPQFPQPRRAHVSAAITLVLALLLQSSAAAH